ncbi:MarR family winged helix-turn-helix transcriptional regulator [Pseudoxanthomonas dokdonensis]|uniref:MarR family transcriptional regulator n=1 Tax=Pseudoxanthomonas dokdonensis TaxID=344882 RepID=A0A0R0CG55_9GAMM|nr:MarR family transcriptional regulator [Pseudoxanthomonas dokdonensis]KRG68777.1 MarR family transcriptional regulator [Pseudoxanthomonas dokdonensis]
MGSFDATEKRIEVTCQRSPSFPREPAMLVRLVKHLYKRIHDNANLLLREYGINHAEYDILMMLYGTAEQSLSPGEVAEATGEKSANITRLTDQLCEKGLITRSADANDRRKLVLALSGQGTDLIQRMLPQINQLLALEVGGLGEAEQKRLETLLKKMLEGMDAL